MCISQRSREGVCLCGGPLCILGSISAFKLSLILGTPHFPSQHCALSTSLFLPSSKRLRIFIDCAHRTAISPSCRACVSQPSQEGVCHCGGPLCILGSKHASKLRLILARPTSYLNTVLLLPHSMSSFVSLLEFTCIFSCIMRSAVCRRIVECAASQRFQDSLGVCHWGGAVSIIAYLRIHT